MIDTGHLGAPPDNTETTYDAAPLRTHSLDLAHVDSITTRGRLAASVAPEVTQSIAAIVANAQAVRHFLDLQPPVLDEVRQALDCIVRDAYRASDVIYRIRGLFEEAPPNKEPVEINGAIRDVP
jgi:C4-dicarboxylate-specific signal transduction histidine kinase